MGGAVVTLGSRFAWRREGSRYSPAFKIGLVGFEPTASTSRTWRSSQAEPQPVKKKRRLDRPKGEVNLGFPNPLNRGARQLTTQ
jgi:hypothetical protein